MRGGEIASPLTLVPHKRKPVRGRPGTGQPGIARLRWLVAPLLVVCIVIGADRAWIAHRSAPAGVVAMPRLGIGPRNAAEALRIVDAKVDFARQRAASSPDEWLLQEALASALVARFRLTGSYDDLAETDRALAQARAHAPDASGPIMTEAVFAMLTHRQDAAARAIGRLALSAVPADPDDLAEARAIEGDIAFYRGDMQGAQARYDAADKLDGGATATYRRAVLARARGDFPTALAQFSASARSKRGVAPMQAAGVALQLGAVELARGNAEAAKRWFRQADRAFPGYWLTGAHLAQARAIDGDLPGAIAAMRAIAQRSGSAEAMDATAMLLRAQGEGAESRDWAARADALWRERLRQLPEAAYGHALEHALVFGTPEDALDLATRNLAARPYGESRLLMASARLMNGQSGAALEQLALAEGSGWRSAPLYALRAQALELEGRTREAEQARRQAQALNPHVFEPWTALVWFSHG